MSMSRTRQETELELSAAGTIGGEVVSVNTTYGEESDTGEVAGAERPQVVDQEEHERQMLNLDVIGALCDDDECAGSSGDDDDFVCRAAGLCDDVDRLGSYLEDVSPGDASSAASLVWQNFSAGGSDGKLDNLWADMKKKHKKEVPQLFVPMFSNVPNPAGWKPSYLTSCVNELSVFYSGQICMSRWRLQEGLTNCAC